MLLVRVAVVGWLLVGLCAAALGRAQRTDELIGTPVALGPFQGELFVWETGLELVVYDPAGRVVPPRQIAAQADIARFNGKPIRRSATFSSKTNHVWADVDLVGATVLEIRVEATIRGTKHAATVDWKLADDRMRRNDGLAL